MRYNLESTLPIDAFSPRGGRGPFARGMTLEGGGGGGIGGGISRGLGKLVGGAAKVVAAPFQAVNEVVKAVPVIGPAIDKALVGLDKAVGKTIPGGWGTVAAVATPFLPGAAFGATGTLGQLGITKTGLATGIGALSGSGALRKGNQFNLQGAILGGAMAYGSAKLAEGLQAAGQAAPGGANQAVEQAVKEGAGSSVTPTANALSRLPEIPLDAAGNVAEGAANVPSFSEYYKPPVPPVSAPVPGQFVPPSVGEFGSGLRDVAAGSGEFGLKSIEPGLLGGPPPAGMLDKIAASTGETLKGMGSNLADAGAGIKNLAGFGSQPGTQSAAFNALTNKFGVGSGTALVMGASGLAALEEQRKMLDQQFAQGTIAQQEYDEAVAEIDRQVQIGRETVAANPFRTDTDVSGSLSGSGQDSPKAYETLYANAPSSAATLYENKPYAMGGQVDDELGGDYSAMGMDQGNLQKGLFGLGYAAGGMPRFLSGGGDGMSDSIPARINGSQEARLADGEFVIPADVVSHLGNGSSKAGAKQLYKMMDKVRSARTGRKSQGKQINPRKYLPA